MIFTAKKLPVLISNLVIALICLAAILIYIIAPFWTLKIDYTLKADTLKDLLGSTLDDMGVKIEDIVDENGIKLTVPLTITSGTVFSSLFASDTEAFVSEQLIEKNVDSIMESLNPVLDEISEKGVKSVAKSQMKEQLSSQIKNLLPDGTDTQKVLDDLGISDEVLGQKTEELYEIFSKEDATVDEVADYIANTVTDLLTGDKVDELYPELAGADIDAQEIKNTMNDILTDMDLVDEEGHIKSIDSMIAALLDGMMGEKTDNAPTPESLPEESAPGEEAALASKYELLSEEAPAEGNSSADLTAKVKELLMDKIPEEAAGYIAIALKVCAGLLIFSILAWAYLIIKMIVKLFKPNPGIRLGFPIWLGWIPQFLLGYVISLFMLFGAGLLSSISPMLEGLSISSRTSGLVPSIFALALFIFSFFYRSMRKKLN